LHSNNLLGKFVFSIAIVVIVVVFGFSVRIVEVVANETLWNGVAVVTLSATIQYKFICSVFSFCE